MWVDNDKEHIFSLGIYHEEVDEPWVSSSKSPRTDSVSLVVKRTVMDCDPSMLQQGCGTIKNEDGQVAKENGCTGWLPKTLGCIVNPIHSACNVNTIFQRVSLFDSRSIHKLIQLQSHVIHYRTWWWWSKRVTPSYVEGSCQSLMNKLVIGLGYS